MKNRQQQLHILHGTMNEAKEFVRDIVSDCASAKSEEWSKGFITGFNLTFSKATKDLFSPENYQSEDPEAYAAGHDQGMARGRQYQDTFFAGLIQAGIMKPAANNNRKEKE